ncbi:MAG: CRISPR-associated endonuclease Cas1 [bacterium]|nr:CRISPR-associated endonuclease Cas1 [bacterium]
MEITCHPENTFRPSAIPPIPARMLNEFVYCPRLGYLMWVQGEFEHSADTVEGGIKHRRVDKGGGSLPEDPGEEEIVHARSVSLGSETLGVTGKIDLVEGEGNRVTPVDYKRGKRPHVEGGVYDPEKVQLCAYGLLLKEHGFECVEGFIYFVGSKERVPVPFDGALVSRTMAAIEEFRKVAAGDRIPPPLDGSPKCVRCSLVGICLPDEVGFLSRRGVEPRPIFPSIERGLPMYVQSPRGYVRKDGERMVVEVAKEQVAAAAYGDVSQVALFGPASMTTPALHECLRREIPVTWFSYGGWFMGHTFGSGHRNVTTRTAQYRASFDDGKCLDLSRRLVAGKIANCRTLLRRNWKGGPDALPSLMTSMRGDVRRAVRAPSIESLLGAEGGAAGRYFANFSGMMNWKDEGEGGFDFNGRNRRPPRDPVNALLSFAYAMLVREWVVALSGVGLDPYRGFYHQPRFGRPALALDMMEPFRPLVADSTVLTAINNGEVRAGDFVRTAGACALTEKGRRSFIAAFERRMGLEVTHPIFKYRISYRRLLEVEARLLVRFLMGELKRYPVFMTR